MIARNKVLEDLHGSQLVAEERLSQFLSDHNDEGDPKLLLQKLVDAGLITAWQSKGLLAGKWRGYFLGKYKLLHPLGVEPWGVCFWPSIR